MFYFPKRKNQTVDGPAHRSAQAGLQAGGVAETAGPQAGPDRGQAGGGPEGAGLAAGPGRHSQNPVESSRFLTASEERSSKI